MKQMKAEKSLKLRQQFKEEVKALGADDYMCNLLCLLLNEAYRTRHHFRIGNGVVLTHYGNGIETALRSYYFHIHSSENDDKNDDNYFAFWDTWIVRFIDTEYVSSPMANNYLKWTEISNVTILRLKFITDGKVYNLGVVDNKQTGSKDPLGTADTKLDDFMEALKEIFKTFGLVMLAFFIGFVVIWVLGIFFPVIKGGVKGAISVVGRFFVCCLKGIWFLLSLPFVLIGKLFKRKDKYDGEDFET